MTQLITIENRSTVLSPKDVFNTVWAVNYHVAFQYGRSRWVTGRFAPAGHVAYLPPGVKPPVGAWNLILLDKSDQAGALGYHDDEKGTGIPYADVFCKDAIADGSSVSAVACHEADEMLVDPDVNNVRKVLRAATGQWYIVEVGDPVQGNDFDVGAPEGRPTGQLACDFALPAWWELEPENGNGYSYRRSVTAPWAVAPQGYMSVAPANDPTNWGQIFGHQQDRLPTWASRLPRIHGTR